MNHCGATGFAWSSGRSTNLSNLLDGGGEDVQDDHVLLRRRPPGHFHQDHVGVEHQEAQVEELRHKHNRTGSPSDDLLVYHTLRMLMMKHTFTRLI